VAKSFKNLYISLISWVERIWPGTGMPVLLYHSIGSDNSKMSVSPQNFEQQLIRLRSHGYSSASLEDLNSYFDKQVFPQKKVMITFDDGFLDNFEIAAPLLKKYGFGAVFFIAGKYIGLTADFCSNDVDRVKKMMSDDQLQDLHGGNLEVANHFFSHRILASMDEPEIRSEYEQNVNRLAKLTAGSESVKYVAYPKNKKGNVSKLLESIGVRLGFGGRPGVVTESCDKYDLPRIQVYNADLIDKFMARLSGYYYIAPSLMSGLKSVLRSPWFYGLLLLVLSRFVFFWLGLAGFPVDAALVGDWWTLYGGDEVNYFGSARAIMDGQFLPRAHPVGFPIFLIPFILLANPVSFIDIFPLISFVNGVVLHSVVLILIYFIAKEILSSRLKAYIVAIAFNVYPYLFYFLFKLAVASNNIIDPFINSRFRQLMFWHVGSDPLSTVLIMASLLILVLTIKNKINSAGLMALVGFMASWAAVARLQNLIILPIFFFTLLILKKIRLLKYFTFFGAPLILFQAYVNLVSRGSIFRTSYKINGGSGLDIPIFDFSYAWRIITYPIDYGVVLFVPLLIGLALIAWGLYCLIHSHRALGWFLTGYMVVSILFILFLEPTFRNPRYFLPVIPVMLIVLYFPLDKLINQIRPYVKSKR
jgi:peptidoglycan/xylan/chitin deacetylase (PgdA/CDA1 family)